MRTEMLWEVGHFQKSKNNTEGYYESHRRSKHSTLIHKAINHFAELTVSICFRDILNEDHGLFSINYKFGSKPREDGKRVTESNTSSIKLLFTVKFFTGEQKRQTKIQTQN